MKRFFSILAIAPALLLLATCSESTNPVTDDELDFSGITRTLDHSTIIEDDTADWQPRSLDVGNGLVFFRPAVPNPASVACSVLFNISEGSLVKMLVVSRTRDTVITLTDALFFYRGPYVATWDLSDKRGNPVAAGIYRIYSTVISATDSSRRVDSYGDVEVVR